MAVVELHLGTAPDADPIRTRTPRWKLIVEYRRLGRTGLKVSPVVLGTANFSWLTNEPDSFAIMDRALELGVNFLDTSDNYNAGQTEALIGRWLALGGGRREKVVLATKVYSPPMEWASPDPAKRMGTWVGPNDRGLSARHIRMACDASLKRLQTDHIDLYQMHHIDRATPIDEVWQAMELLVQQGKVLYIGSSNFAGWHIAHAQEAANRRNFLGLASEQSIYNLKNRTVELEVLPACRHYGLGFIPYSPVAAGALGGKPDSNERGRRTFMKSEGEQMERFVALCAELGHKPADVAVAWVANQPGVTGPIIGPRTLAQFEGSVRAIGIKWSDETNKRLDAIFPGPGGQAPEAYTW
jgi:aryl-alcohol dehydrogenase-like predicted oxidoreductase